MKPLAENKQNLLDHIIKNRLDYSGLVEINDEVLHTLAGREGKLPALKYLKPLKIQRKFYTFIISSLLLMNTEEMKEIIEDKKAPNIWKLFIRVIATGAKDGDIKKIQFLLDHASGIDVHSRDVATDDVKNAVIVLPNPSEYKEDEVMENQSKIKKIKIEDIDKELK